jgi:uncharacterized protein YprB with RNaseH-like and TPR domain
MYRIVMSLRGRLSRLSMGPAAAPVAAPPEPAPSATARLEELRAKMGAILQKHARPSAPPPPVDVDLPFAREDTPLGPLWSRTLLVSGAHRVGRAPVTFARGASTDLLALLALDPQIASLEPARALFLDTETTGLAGGTGTVAFLVGLAYFTDAGLVLEQLLVRALGEEGPVLARVSERIESASHLVTYNGKSFDLPLLRTRFAMARLPAPAEPPHLDLLHVARRIHVTKDGHAKKGLRLVALERDLLGFERVDDVPSGDVAACYLHFLRTGDARGLLAVVEHNAWDVATMVALYGLYGEPLEGTTLAASDLVGVARTLKRAGCKELAEAVATRAVDGGAGEAALKARAEIAKARGDRARALADFEELSRTVDDPAVRLELAKLYEHFVKDPTRALGAALRGTTEAPEAAARRRARLEKKRAACAKPHGS